MAALATSTDWGAVATFAGVGFAIVAAALSNAYRAGRLAQKVEDNTQAVDKMQRHQDGIMATLWPLMWRTGGIESHLAERDGYHPPTLIPEYPGRDTDRG